MKEYIEKLNKIVDRINEMFNMVWLSLWKVYELVRDFNLDQMTNEELEQQLYHEVLYYSEDLLKLCRLIRKNIPRKMMYRLISKLYRVRTKI